ncbi:hypothetical protein AB1Y20_001563 [Prymnesium parvum]|uniref:Cyclic nucleotide-binding domain-containing protein n=1 Tax=Prymnesium parvum TaxID=97485 RepID=A0AB34KBR0_PRYPA
MEPPPLSPSLLATSTLRPLPPPAPPLSARPSPFPPASPPRAPLTARARLPRLPTRAPPPPPRLHAALRAAHAAASRASRPELLPLGPPIDASAARQAEEARRLHAMLAAQRGDGESPRAARLGAEERRSAARGWGGEGAGSPRARALLEQPSGLGEDEALDALRQAPFLRRAADGELRAVLERSQRKVVSRYSTILREGSFGSTFYVLLQGSVRAKLSADVAVELRPPSCFGESAFLPGVPRHADVMSLSACELLLIHRDDVDALHVDLEEVRARITHDMLYTLNFFKGLYSTRRLELARTMQVGYYAKGEQVFAEGEPGDSFYMLVRGSVGIFKSVPAEQMAERCVATYKYGTDRPWFGELAIWNGKPRSATACCLEPCVLIQVRSAYFGAFLKLCPEFVAMFEATTTALARISVLCQQQAVPAFARGVASREVSTCMALTNARKRALKVDWNSHSEPTWGRVVVDERHDGMREIDARSEAEQKQKKWPGAVVVTPEQCIRSFMAY